jgi:hypothetical protein
MVKRLLAALQDHQECFFFISKDQWAQPIIYMNDIYIVLVYFLRVEIHKNIMKNSQLQMLFYDLTLVG